MKKIVPFLFFLCVMAVFADNRETYIDLLENNQLDELQTHLKKWEREDKKSPDLYLAWSEYELLVGGKTGFASDTYIIDEKNEYAVIDPKNGKTIGYLNRDYFYGVKVIDAALSHLDKGLSYAPDRIDLYFAKISLFQQIGEYDKQANTVIDVLNRSRKNENKWTATGNESISDGEIVLLENIQDVFAFWFNIFTESSAAAAKKTAEIQISLYPDNFYGYNNLGLYYAFSEDIASALDMFIKTEKIQPNAPVVFSNIAYCQELLGNRVEAKKYYEKMIQVGGEEEKKFARERIAELEKN